MTADLDVVTGHQLPHMAAYPQHACRCHLRLEPFWKNPGVTGCFTQTWGGGLNVLNDIKDQAGTLLVPIHASVHISMYQAYMHAFIYTSMCASTHMHACVHI